MGGLPNEFIPISTHPKQRGRKSATTDWVYHVGSSSGLIAVVVMALLSYLSGSKRVSPRPPDPDTMTNIALGSYTEGRNLIVIEQVRVDYGTEIPVKMNPYQINVRGKRKRMTWLIKFGKLLWPADEKNSVFFGFKTSRLTDIQMDTAMKCIREWSFQVWMKYKVEGHR